jgi:hypothetical protein
MLSHIASGGLAVLLVFGCVRNGLAWLCLRRKERELDRAIAAWGEMLRQRAAAPCTTIDDSVVGAVRVLAERGHLR